MTAHRVAADLQKAPVYVPDPGDTKTIRNKFYGEQTQLTSSSSAETRTLAAPTKEGIEHTVTLDTDGGGDITLTVTGGYNDAGDTAIVFDDAGDTATFRSIKQGSSYYWRIIHQQGTDAEFDDFDVKTLSIGGTAVTATAAELNQIDGNLLKDMTPGTGISSGTGTICEHSVTKVGGLYKTEILVDLTDLADDDATNDIIGVSPGAANCHLGQITDAVNGTIIAGRITCFETPATGDPDIDLYYADGATGAQGANIDTADSGSATQLIDHGDWAAEETDYLTALPAADEYLYLAVGAATPDDGTYTAGILLIELWGT